MANAKITMPGGVSIDVDGTAEEIAAVLENLRKTNAASGSGARVTTGIPQGRGEISRLIETLKSEDFLAELLAVSGIYRKNSLRSATTTR